MVRILHRAVSGQIRKTGGQPRGASAARANSGAVSPYAPGRARRSRRAAAVRPVERRFATPAYGSSQDL
jgi:hypothetical protein